MLSLDVMLRLFEAEDQKVSKMLRIKILSISDEFGLDISSKHWCAEVLLKTQSGVEQDKYNRMCLTSVFHEIGTGINVLWGFLKLGIEDNPDEDEWQEFLSIAENNLKAPLIFMYDFLEGIEVKLFENNHKAENLVTLIFYIGYLEWFRSLKNEIKSLLPFFQKLLQEDNDILRHSQNLRVAIQAAEKMNEIRSKYFDLLKTNEAVRFIDPQFAADFRKNL